MYDRNALRGDLSVKDIFRLFRYNREFNNLHPHYFKPDGTLVFCGPQGSGKTLSACRYVYNLVQSYPRAIVVSNVHLTDIDYIPFDGLTNTINNAPNNGEFGTIILIDEIQTEFSSLESSKVSPTVLAIISQQRKRRVHIVGTAQLFTRISKAFREQIRGAVDCDAILGGSIQRNRIIDFARCAYDINGNLTETAYSGQFLWTRKKSDFDRYDTTQVIERKGVLDIVRN